ncbi:hypothetical protein ACZ90_17030 [Streptomyces albus subsp. albus]|nr:hypothetical protein ACZ90_17030 [Streptomyces albus subsp. albus]
MSMARWGLIAETSVRWGEGRDWTATVLGYAEGTREFALRELEKQARQRFPAPGRRRSPQVRFFREGDGFLMIVGERMQTRYTVAELLYDSEAPAPAQPEPGAAVPQDAEPPRAAEPDVARDEDGVPITPSWLGRSDLS